MKFENVTVVLVLALRSQIIHLAELWAEEGGPPVPPILHTLEIRLLFVHVTSQLAN